MLSGLRSPPSETSISKRASFSTRERAVSTHARAHTPPQPSSGTSQQSEQEALLRYARSHFQIPKVFEESQRGENTKELAESAQRGDPEPSYRLAGEVPTASLMRCGSSKRATVDPRATARLPHSPGNPEQARSPPSRSVRMREWALPHETCSTCVSWGLSRGSGTGEGSSTYSYPLAETRTAGVTARHTGGEAQRFGR